MRISTRDGWFAEGRIEARQAYVKAEIEGRKYLFGELFAIRLRDTDIFAEGDSGGCVIAPTSQGYAFVGMAIAFTDVGASRIVFAVPFVHIRRALRLEGYYSPRLAIVPPTTD